MVRRCSALLAAVAVLTACGGGDDRGEERERLPRDIAAGKPREEPPPAPNLPRDGKVEVAGVELTGRRVHAELWVTDGPPPRAAALWSRLAARYGDTGLWLVLLEVPVDELQLDAGYDWRPAAGQDPDRVLRRQWRQNRGGGAFPGLGRGGPPAEGGARLAREVMDGVTALALVPVDRPADAPAAMGWTGPVNWYDDPAETSAVLRGWAERYDVQVVGLGLDTLTAAVGRPPRGDDARLAAAEQYAFCPDIVDQGYGSRRKLARAIDGVEAWRFWWD